MTDFIALDAESPSKTPFGIVALAAHLYLDDKPVELITLKRPIQITQNDWFNKNVLSQVQTFENNCNDASEIYSKFLKFYVRNDSPTIITYCSEPYEQFIVNYLETSLDRHIPHFDIYQQFPNLFPEFDDLEKLLSKQNKTPQEQARHNPIYDARITGEVFSHLTN